MEKKARFITVYRRLRVLAPALSVCASLFALWDSEHARLLAIAGWHVLHECVGSAFAFILFLVMS